MLTKIKTLFENLNDWGAYILSAISVLFLLIFVYRKLSRIRKKIVFEPIVNRFEPGDTELGKSIGDLLLFKLKYIKQTHQKSSSKIGLWNTFEDIPSFRQSIDKEMKLLASVELGNYGGFITGLFTFLLKLVPLVIRPATVKGSINRYGAKKTILNVSLDNYNPKKWKDVADIPWEIKKDELTVDEIPELIEELAHKIYIDLTGGDLFKTGHCFNYFTKGLNSYLRYTELEREEDLKEAEKYYEEALRHEENNPVVCYNLGVLKYYQYQNHLNDAAISYFTKAMSSTDKILRTRALSGLANAYSQKRGRFKSSDKSILEKAIDCVDQAISLDSKSDYVCKAYAYAYHQYGEELVRQSNSAVRTVEHPAYKILVRAEKYYKKAIRINKKHFISHNNLANLYLEWAITLEKNIRPKLMQNLWLVRLKSIFTTDRLVINRAYLLNKTIKHCKEALEINPSYAIAYDNLGNAFYENESYNDAREAFLKALLYRPNYPEAKNDLAMIYLTSGFKNTRSVVDQDIDYIYEAERVHQEALALIDPKKEEQRRLKLIRKFNNRKKLYRL